jgi:uncharacterized protein with GYD domain
VDYSPLTRVRRARGGRRVKETIGRAEAFKEMAKKVGVSVKDIYWTLGSDLRGPR